MFPTPPQVRDAHAAAALLGAICPDVRVVPAPELFGTWPQAPNQHFFHAANYVHNIGAPSPWMWLELDALPVQRNWATKLHMAYNASGARFMGCLRDTPHKDQAGNLTYVKGDQLMSGVGLYPGSVPAHSWAFKDLLKMELTQPFDLHMRGEMQGAGWAHTDLIQDIWNTQNYRMENGVIVCDAAPTEFKQMTKGGTVSSEAVIVHGCKDGSLARIILGVADPVVPVEPEKSLFPSSPTVAMPPPAEQPRLKTKEESDEVCGMTHLGKTAKEWHDLYMYASATYDPTYGQKSDCEPIIKALEKKSIRLPVLAKMMGVSNEMLLKTMQEAKGKFKIAPGPLKWVSLAKS